MRAVPRSAVSAERAHGGPGQARTRLVWLAVWMLCALALMVRAVLADEPARKPAAEPADAEFLEFLGSVGSEDEEWLSFLSRADVAHPARDPSKVAAAPHAPARDQPAEPANAANADTKQ
jgi:hypothetical protein